jgi:hypothetical protein
VPDQTKGTAIECAKFTSDANINRESATCMPTMYTLLKNDPQNRFNTFIKIIEGSGVYQSALSLAAPRHGARISTDNFGVRGCFWSPCMLWLEASIRVIQYQFVFLCLA